ncbi:hypothetical protein GGTG_12509 [Gaeumannomyces tritici R3-111a-1]|uniref:Uncharacterized protein n=1 Tax=Gaeumannomyces tritici (strain R3-111a-1) TaxID=644352 RepID=J3PG85_GAET3|nr:hypothetical protein GGTG_12509 [Gaeumannomyces tritici R3-111a-1]EJT69625.1 hypothetical protein GGTG_12509 [Gaeumannomyces tritici R3-111a-1]
MESDTCEILESPADAAGMLQKLGGCCDSFTFLYWRPEDAELYRVSFRSSAGSISECLKYSAGILDLVYEMTPFLSNEAACEAGLSMTLGRPARPRGS